VKTPKLVNSHVIIKIHITNTVIRIITITIINNFQKLLCGHRTISPIVLTTFEMLTNPEVK
jgi:hypothetical protein